MKCAANPSPTKSQKSDRILRIIATETPSLNERPSERSVAVVVPSSTPSPKGTNEATSWAHRFADSTRYAFRKEACAVALLRIREVFTEVVTFCALYYVRAPTSSILR